MHVIYNKFSEYKLKDTKELMKNISKDFNSFVGKRFEDVSREFLIAKFPLDSIGNWWGNRRINDAREEIEIDLVATEANTILFVECKWKENINAEEIVRLCEEKSRFVEWNKKDRNESFVVFAKSFEKKIGEFNSKKVYCFDLKDIENE